MVIVILMFTSLLLQTNCVPITEGEDTYDASKARYNFNHPPTVEEYNPIEYNEDSAYKARGVKFQKRAVPQSANTENNFARSRNFDKRTNIQTATLKPTVTSPKQNDNANVSKKPRQRDPVVPIIESENYVYSHNGNFHYSYLGGDGTTVFEKGYLKVFDDKRTGESVEGSFSYTDNDGNDFSLSYTADENGYRPVGAHLPTPPPIPPAIARALQYLSTKNAVESTTKLFH